MLTLTFYIVNVIKIEPAGTAGGQDARDST